MITIKNTQQTITIDTEQLKKDAQTLLDDLRYSDFDLGIMLTSTQTMRRHNREFRGKDRATDILSFPHHPDLKAGKQITPETDDDKNLGDIILCPEYISGDAPNWGHTFEQRIRVLLVHGVCHLLGYDHIKDDDNEVMKVEEERLLKLLDPESSLR